MLDKVHLFTKSKGAKNKYLCPNCGKNDFEVKPTNGTYTCWSGGCSTNEIRSAIDAMEGNVFVPGKAKEPAQKWVKPIRAKSSKEYFYPDRNGNDLVKVLRVDPGNGDKKSFPQFHWNGFAWASGNPDEFKVNVPIYRYAEVRQAIADDSLVFVVEGESAADALWAIGIAATTTIGGAGKFTKYGNYTADFDGGMFVLAPDCDTPGIKHVTEIAAFLGDKVHGYYLAGSSPDLWVDPVGGFDIKDDITDRHLDRDRILASVISADEYRKTLNPVAPKPVGRQRKSSPTPIDRDYQQLAQELGFELLESGCDADGIPSSKLVKLELDLFAMYGSRLEFNEMSCEIELDREPMVMDLSKSFVVKALSGNPSQQDCDIALTSIARRNQYSPVKEYLESLRGKGVSSFVENFPQRYWGNEDPLQNMLFFKKLIACVARVMSPGCEDHTLLILKGGQGVGKSSALKALGSEEWFTDDLRSLDNKDELAKLSRFWLLELAEVDYLFSKKETTLFKRFLSGSKDTFRPPYGRSNITKPRTSALFATTNSSEFLSDPTGARRYWVVDVGNDIDITQIRLDRDLIWAAAVAAYDEGVEWWLPKELELYHHQVNEQYQQNDMWDGLIEDRLATVTSFQGSIEYTFIPVVADKILNIPTDKQDGRTSRRIGAILRLMGFDTDNIRIDGKQTKVWARSSVVTQVFDKSDLSNLGNSLKPLPSLTVTKVTLDTQVLLSKEEKLISSNAESELINNCFLGNGTTQVTGKLGNKNNETEDGIGSQAVTELSIKVGDRVWIAKYNENGTVEAIYRNDPPKHHEARVIRDSGKPCLLDILPGQYKIITSDSV